ncbi:MAG: hypothetical protein JWM51_112 [Microbacteriaceae bacterium]|nr:hypothetical protein [Microbacteriaceae bacterium]
MTLERRSWTYLAVAVAAYGAYLVYILSRGSAPLVELDYVPAMLWSIAIAIAIALALALAIVVGIALGIVQGIFTPRREHAKDARDREIELLCKHVGQAFLVIGGVAALLLAIVEADHLSIANVVYLCFVLAAVVGSVAKVVVYRRGFRPW